MLFNRLRVNIKLGLFISFLLLASAMALSNNEVPAKIEVSTDIFEGVIGVLEEGAYDDPYDNVFHFQLNKLPSSAESIVMNFELFGVANPTGIGISFNDELAKGGKIVELNEKWTNHIIVINPKSIKSGDNVIRFTQVTDVIHQYRVRNIQISSINSVANHRDVIINKSSLYNNGGALAGFILGEDADLAHIQINGKQITNLNADFEYVNNNQSQTQTNKLAISVHFPDGQKIIKDFTFEKSAKSADLVFQQPVAIDATKFILNAQKNNMITTDHFHFDLRAAGVNHSMQMSVSPLRPLDVAALNDYLINVTEGASGFRCLPHGAKFNHHGTITLSYDQASIPQHYTVEDLRIFYFDETERKWTALADGSLDDKNQLISAKTDHFTDFLVGVLKVPETPRTETFLSTSMSSIEGPSVTDGITFIQPPTANSMGTANMEFPIDLPPGRQGMQPNLAIQYNSEIGNGWCGLGWNIEMSAIHVDTRWGVPRYSSVVETETYNVNGQQLAPVAHRGAPVDRSAEKQFYPRIESEFNTIIRHGTSPSNYWWEITTTLGAKEYYGGHPESGLNTSAILKDANGNISQWGLTERRELNDNFISYQYNIVQHSGVPSATTMGFQLYLSNIFYTGHGSSEGPFQVEFIRDRQLGENERLDVGISARTGFKQINADLLRKINIQYNGENIRSYELQYILGPFNKSLIEHIICFDENDAEFYRHRMEYYDDVLKDGKYTPFLPKESWSSNADEITGEILASSSLFPNETSMLGGSGSTDWSLGGAATVGLIGDLLTKTNTAGVNFTYGRADGYGLIAFVDINGDGLSDKVYHKNDKLSYRPNQINKNPSAPFGAERNVIGIKQFSKTVTSSFAGGVEAHPGIGFVGYTNTTVITNVNTYFSDFNGDGLVDVVYNGVVHFNHLNANGDPEFTVQSDDTPSPITIGAEIDPDLVVIDPAEQEAKIDANPLHDVVRMWEAPYDGFIRIIAPARLLEDPSQEAQMYTKKDGVRLAIQKNGDNESWSTIIPADDYSNKTPSNVNNMEVDAGDRIYFRVQSRENGAYDQVIWDPEITYRQQTINEFEPTGKQFHQFRASEDYILASCQTVSMPLEGRITIDGRFFKPLTSDNIIVSILRENTAGTSVINQTTYRWDQTADLSLNLRNIAIEISDVLIFKIFCPSNVEWSAVKWTPRITYTSTVDGTPVTGVNGEPLISFCPAPEYQMYNRVVQKTRSWVAPANGTISLEERLDFDLFPSGTVTLSIKGPKKLYANTLIPIILGAPNQDDPLTANVRQGDVIFIEYHTPNPELGVTLDRSRVRITFDGNEENLDVGFHSQRIDDDIIYGPMYRNWGLFIYNGNRGRANNPIDEDDLMIDPDAANNAGDIGDIDDPNNIGPTYDVSKETFVLLVSDIKNGYWIGSDNLTYVRNDTISSSRLGEDDVLPLDFSSNGSTLIMPSIMTKSYINSLAGGVSLGPSGASASVSFNKTENELDVLDLNGDNFPDIATREGIQFTNSRGGLEENAILHNLEHHTAGSFAWGLSASVGFVHSSATNSGDVSQSRSSGGGRGSMQSKGSRKTKSSRKSQRSKAAKSKANKSSKKSGDSSRASKNGIGIDAGFTSDVDSTEQTWADINGDGLADMLYKNGMVALNLGYKFSPKEYWGFDAIHEGTSFDYGGGLGVNLFSGSIVSGVSINRTDNESTMGLFDVNGDGLVDMITAIEPLKVKLNTGNGFASEVIWSGADFIDQGSATGESVNVAFTVCIPIVIFGIKICINPSSSIGRGVSRTTQQLDDADGDGFLDYLESNSDGLLNVRRSAIGRTNLLRKIHRPLGGTVEIDYASEGNTYDLPFNRWVLSSVEIYDGVPGDGADRRKTTFNYRDGKYDRHERDFYGFKEIDIQELDTENNDALYRTTSHEYEVSNYYTKGRETGYTLYDDSANIYFKEEHVYVLKDVMDGSVLLPAAAQADDGMAFPALEETHTFYYEGDINNSIQTSIKYAYDNFGNIIESIDRGDGTDQDKLITTATYHNNPAQHIYSIPSSVTLTADGKTLRRAQQDIDDKGNIEQIREFVDANTAAISDMEYDDYGNIISMTRPQNINGQRMFYNYTFDDQVNTYLVSIDDAYGYHSESNYDVRYGQVLEQRDINKQTMSYSLDEKGRTKTIVGPFELAAGLPYSMAYEYETETTPAYVVSKKYDEEHEQDLINIAYVDGYGREIQTKKSAIVNNQALTIVSGVDFVDAFGRVKSTYHPITEATGSFAYNTTVDNVAPAQIGYDILDRGTLYTLQNGAVSTIDFSIDVDNMGTPRMVDKKTDALGNITANYKDARERVRGEQQLGPNGVIWSNFEYNAISELEKIIDTESHVTENEYDNLGRKIKTIHPDAGSSEMIYDLADNLIEKKTDKITDEVANNGLIKYTLDYERVVEINYPKNYQNKVQLHYGDTSAQHNRIGRLWLREDASGGEEYFYGPLGETVKTIRTLLISQTNIQTFVTGFEYDTWGRLQQLIYPDGEKVFYHYNKAGMLDRIDGNKYGVQYNYIDAISYDKFEERRQMTYGNKTSMSYSFESDRRRLTTITGRTADGNEFMNTTYVYDDVDNIKSIENTASVTANGLGGPVAHNYTYDELYRISAATGDWEGKKSKRSYQLNLEYDDLHNILNKTQTLLVDGKDDPLGSYQNIYMYDGTSPHRPSEVSGRLFHYDKTGNLLATQGTKAFTYSQLLWDEENRLAGVSNNGYISRYTYDGNGDRVIKSHGGQQGIFVDGAAAGAIDHVNQYTAYVNPFFVVEKNKFTKHYFADEQKLLSKVGNGQFNFPLLAQTGFVSAGDLDYAERMKLLRTVQDEYYKSLGIAPGAPTLYGHSAQPEITGNPLPTNINGDYNNAPDGWPQATANPDTTGAPGPPVFFIPADSVHELFPGYAFDSTAADVFKEVDVFYYHNDHLGSAHFLTDFAGEVRQHTAYTPFGEIFVEEHSSSQLNPYLFNGKQLDEQTGYYYYGARYFDPKLSLWNSVDPLWNLFPTFSPYAYTFHNPMRYRDVDGRKPGDAFSSPDAAAKDFMKRYNPPSIAENVEYGSSIYYNKNEGFHSYSHPATGVGDGVDPSDAPKGAVLVADIHTHSAYDPKLGDDNDVFSDVDIADNRAKKIVGYVATPRGRGLKFDPNAGPNGTISTLTKKIPADPNHPKVRRMKKRRKKSPRTRTAKGINLAKRNNKMRLGGSRARY